MRSILFYVGLLIAAACTSPQPVSKEGSNGVRAMRWPIVGGGLDLNPTHGAVAFIEIYDRSGQIAGACSGTLVSSKVVVTAGHCVSDSRGRLVDTPTRYGVYFDVDNDGTPDWPKKPCWLTCTSYPCSCAANVNVGLVQRMSGYQESWGSDQVPINDIALVRLSDPAPAAVRPIPYLNSTLANAHLRGNSPVEFAGYGDQGYPGVDCCDQYRRPRGCQECPNGTRFHVRGTLSSICTAEGGCGTTPPWTLSYDGASGPCSGDSGGPAFLTVNGTEYVAGVTSYGDASCQTMGVSTLVDHFEGFIAAAIDDGQLALGGSCNRGSECASGFCASGVCCESACSGACEACSAAAGARADGRCQPVEGLACDDGNACTEGDSCHAGECVGGAPKTCPATKPCELDSTCDPQTGCADHAPRPDGARCDDGNACTLGDHCAGGACVSDSVVQCAEPNQCQLSVSCDRQTGACVSVDKPETAPCNDLDANTTEDHCQAGTCVGRSLAGGECEGEVDGAACSNGGTCQTGRCQARSGSSTSGCGCGAASGAEAPSTLVAVVGLALARRRRPALARRSRTREAEVDTAASSLPGRVGRTHCRP